MKKTDDAPVIARRISEFLYEYAPRALVPGTMNEKCLAYEQNMNMNQRHDSKTCWCQASTCGGSPHSEMVQILLKGYI